MQLQNLDTHSHRQLFAWRIPPLPNEMNPSYSSEIIDSTPFVPLDSSGQTQLSKFLRSENTIDANWNATSNQVLSFSFDSIQEKWIEHIFKIEIPVSCENTTCTFTLTELFNP